MTIDLIKALANITYFDAIVHHIAFNSIELECEMHTRAWMRGREVPQYITDLSQIPHDEDDYEEFTPIVVDLSTLTIIGEPRGLDTRYLDDLQIDANDFSGRADNENYDDRESRWGLAS